jgi:hypothetical protein
MPQNGHRARLLIETDEPAIDRRHAARSYLESILVNNGTNGHGADGPRSCFGLSASRS